MSDLGLHCLDMFHKMGARLIAMKSLSVLRLFILSAVQHFIIAMTVNKEKISLNYEPVHEISNNVACATSKASDQTAHTRSLIRAFGSRLSILWLLSY